MSHLDQMFRGKVRSFDQIGVYCIQPGHPVKSRQKHHRKPLVSQLLKPGKIVCKLCIYNQAVYLVGEHKVDRLLLHL